MKGCLFCSFAGGADGELEAQVLEQAVSICMRTTECDSINGIWQSASQVHVSQLEEDT